MWHKINQNPELLFLLSVLFYWVSTSTLLNPVAIILMVLGVIMLTKRFKVISVSVGFMYMLINIYLILALISEFREFSEINYDAILMLSIGSVFIALNLLIGYRLVVNNIPKEGKRTQLI